MGLRLSVMVGLVWKIGADWSVTVTAFSEPCDQLDRLKLLKTESGH
jgi:hypothetical protein